MKKDIHPDYKTVTVTCITCNTKFETGSTKEDIKVDSCSSCNPFFTGAQRSIGADSRADKFKKKYNLK